MGRLRSLRTWLLVAMITSAAAGLAGAAAVYQQLTRASERTQDRRSVLGEARVIAAQVERGASLRRLATLQALLSSDQLVITRNHRTVFRGPAHRAGDFEVAVTVPFRGGVVVLRDYTAPAPGTTLDFELVVGATLLLVIAVAILTATSVTASVRKPVARAIRAAERVANGDFTARVGSSGPAELAQLGEAFDSMAARLERVDTDQRQFLADVAHEIATPVNTLTGFALALTDGAVSSPEQQVEVAMIIEQQTERLRALLSDLRELTRLDLADGVRQAPIDVGAFARQLVARFRPEADAKKIMITLEADSGTLTTDGRLLDTVASNLLANAIRYTPAGGRVAIRVRLRHHEFELLVRDSGPGIAPEHQRRIFERLYRIDETRDRATGGSGLGLAIATRAAASLGGAIRLQSAPGEGSEFRLTVPRRPSPPQS